MFVTMKEQYVKKIYEWAQGLKETISRPLSGLTKEPERFKKALELLYDSGHNCGIISGEDFVFKPTAKGPRLALPPASVLVLLKAGVLEQCPPKAGAFILFPSGTALEIKKAAKNWVKAATHFGGVVTEAQYTSKELPLEKLFIVDYPIHFNSN